MRHCNRANSARWYIFEHTFGSIQSWMSGGRVRYRGLAKVHTQGVLELMAYNMKHHATFTDT
ncbi:MAG: transposase [Bacteroides sp.]